MPRPLQAWKEGRGTAAVSAEPGASLLSEGLMQRELAASAIAAVACSGICRLPRGPPVLWSASTSAVCWPKATGQTMGNVRAMQAAGRATYGTAHLYGSRWSIGSCWAMLHSQGHDQPGGPSGQQSMRSDGRAHIPTRQAGAARQEPARPARGSAHPGHAEASGHQQQQRVGQRAGLYREGQAHRLPTLAPPHPRGRSSNASGRLGSSTAS